MSWFTDHFVVEFRYSVFYFFFYAGYMPFLLFLPVYLKYFGLSPFYVGFLNGLRPILQAVGTPVLIMLGKSFRSAKLLFIVSSLIMIFKVLFMFVVLLPGNQQCAIEYFAQDSRPVVRHTPVYNRAQQTPRRTLVMLETLPHSAILVRDLHAIKGVRNETFSVRRDHLTSQRTTKSHRGVAFLDTNTNVSGIGEFRKLRKGGSQNKTLNTSRSGLYNAERTSHGKDHYVMFGDQDRAYRIFVVFFILVLVSDLFDATVFTLVDYSCLSRVQDQQHYGFARLLGNAGWGFLTPVIGAIIYHFSHKICGVLVGSFHYVFFFTAGFLFLSFLVGLSIDFTLHESDAVVNSVHGPSTNFQYGLFLSAFSFSGFCNGFLLTFTNWFIDTLGGNSLVMGLSTSLKCAVDIALFFAVAKLTENICHHLIINIGLVGHIIVFLIYYSIKNPWYVIIAEVVHAFFHGLVTFACISFLSNKAPAGSSLSMQVLLQGVYWGMGTGFGSILGGYYLEYSGFIETFTLFTVLTSVVAIVFIILQILSYIYDPRGTLEDIWMVCIQNKTRPPSSSEDELSSFYD